MSQSLLIQRSYSYQVEEWLALGEEGRRNPFLFRGPIPTVGMGVEIWYHGLVSRNPFLFRGPIPTFLNITSEHKLPGRNPFLFRGPIPTKSSRQ